MISVSIMLTIFSLFFTVYSDISEVALQKLGEFNTSIQIYQTQSLIKSLRTFGGPFEYSGDLSKHYGDVLQDTEGIFFNLISGKYEYLSCGRV